MHALKRMRERNITSNDFKNGIFTGEIIETYPYDRPLPSCLINGKTQNHHPIHDVVGTDNKYIYAITAYFPDENQWESDFKTRKEQ